LASSGSQLSIQEPLDALELLLVSLHLCRQSPVR
jgi:hypothetical protein